MCELIFFLQAPCDRSTHRDVNLGCCCYLFALPSDFLPQSSCRSLLAAVSPLAAVILPQSCLSLPILAVSLPLSSSVALTSPPRFFFVLRSLFAAESLAVLTLWLASTLSSSRLVSVCGNPCACCVCVPYDRAVYVTYSICSELNYKQVEAEAGGIG